MIEKLRRFLLSLILAVSCSGALLAYAQTVTQDSVRLIRVTDSLAYTANSNTSTIRKARSRWRIELQGLGHRLLAALRAATVPAPVPVPPPAPPPAPTPPPPPSASVPASLNGLTFTVASAGSNVSEVRVTWNISSDATSYRYAAGPNTGAWAGASGSLTTTAVMLSAVPNGTSIWFCGWARNATGESDSACNSYTVPDAVSPPPAPPPPPPAPPPPPVTPPASGAVLRFEGDQYNSTAELLAATGRWDPYQLSDAKPFITVEDINVPGNVSLQATGCPGGRQKFMRYTFPASPAGEITVGRMLGFNALDSQHDVWIEMGFRMGANFLAAISGNTSAAPVTAYKFVFLTFPSTGRFQQTLVYDNTTAVLGDAATEDRGLFGYPNVMDGQWHVLRWHAKRHPTAGVNQIVMDGAPVYSYTGNTGSADGTRWYGFAIGRNSNRGFSQSTTLDVCWVALYTTAPGW